MVFNNEQNPNSIISYKRSRNDATFDDVVVSHCRYIDVTGSTQIKKTNTFLLINETLQINSHLSHRKIWGARLGLSDKASIL